MYVIAGSLYDDIPPIITFSLAFFNFSTLFNIILNFFSSSIFFDLSSFKNDVNGCIVSTSIDCTRYISCA